MADLVRILVIALATAGIVNTVHTSIMFAPLLARIIAVGEAHPTWRRWLNAGLLCAYCFSHWVGAAMTLLIAPLAWSTIVGYFAAVWLANYFLLFNSILNVRMRSGPQAQQPPRGAMPFPQRPPNAAATKAS